MNTNRFGRFILLGIMGLALLVFSWQCSEQPMQTGSTPTSLSSAAAQQNYDQPPEIITYQPPKYPDMAKHPNLEAEVLVRLTIDAEGKVIKAEATQASMKNIPSASQSPSFEEPGLPSLSSKVFIAAATEAAYGFKFKPAFLKGKPVQSEIMLPFKFKGNDDSTTQPPTPNASTSAQNFQPFDQAPEMLSAFDLTYPELMRKAGIEGTTYLEIGINTAGETETVVVKKSSGNENLDQAAMAAARAMKWKPAHYKGKPVAAQVVLPARFKLSE